MRVLIYPYWNVNGARRRVRAAGSGGFNLSILECKSQTARAVATRCGVLIYPYWNVNFLDSCRYPVMYARFNLSILECK